MMDKVAFIDSNIFLRFLVFDKTNPNLGKKAKKIFENINKEKIKVQTNILIISEMVYVLESYYKLKKDEVCKKLIPIITLENLIIDNKDMILASFSIYQEKNIDFEDAYTFLMMLDKKVEEIYTFDKKHFRRLEGIKILS